MIALMIKTQVGLGVLLMPAVFVAIVAIINFIVASIRTLSNSSPGLSRAAPRPLLVYRLITLV